MHNQKSELRPVVAALLKRSEIEIVDQAPAMAEIADGSTGLIFVAEAQVKSNGHKNWGPSLLSSLARIRAWAHQAGACTVSFYSARGK